MGWGLRLTGFEKRFHAHSQWGLNKFPNHSEPQFLHLKNGCDDIPLCETRELMTAYELYSKALF